MSHSDFLQADRKNEESISEFIKTWREELLRRELTAPTIARYLREGRRFLEWLPSGSYGLSKTAVIEYREYLVERFAPSSVNVAVAAVNSLLANIGCPEMRVGPLRVQRQTYRSAGLGLTRGEYERMVHEAYAIEDIRLALILQTLASTGMRVSELGFLTPADVAREVVWVRNKGKSREVLLPGRLSRLLIEYCAREGIASGPIFLSSKGFPIDRTTVWRGMKRVAVAAGVPVEKAYPHNLRHLFALCHYESYRDLDAVSGLLGHSRVETTRTYIATNEDRHREQVNSLGLVLNMEPTRNGMSVPLRVNAGLSREKQKRNSNV